MSSRAEIEALLSKAERFIRSAKKLRELDDMESAVSRLYYAMFFCAEAILLSKGLSFSRHASVIAALGEHFVKPGLLPAELHRWLRDAFDTKGRSPTMSLHPYSRRRMWINSLSKQRNFLR